MLDEALKSSIILDCYQCRLHHVRHFHLHFPSWLQHEERRRLYRAPPCRSHRRSYRSHRWPIQCSSLCRKHFQRVDNLPNESTLAHVKAQADRRASFPNHQRHLPYVLCYGPHCLYGDADCKELPDTEQLLDLIRPRPDLHGCLHLHCNASCPLPDPALLVQANFWSFLAHSTRPKANDCLKG